VLNDINHYEKREMDKKEFKKVIYSISETWLKLLAPVIPHICEEIWHSIGKKSFISVEKWPIANEKLIDKKIELAEEVLMNTYSDIKQILKLIGKKPNKIHIFIAAEWKFEFFKKIMQIFNEEKKADLNFLIEKMKNEKFWNENKEEVILFLKKFSKDTSKIPMVINERKMEIRAFREAKEFLENEFGCKFEIIKEEKAKIEKAKQALPNKPAIYVE
jgi:leucyl-tRNA synthetase